MRRLRRYTAKCTSTAFRIDETETRESRATWGQHFQKFQQCRRLAALTPGSIRLNLHQLDTAS